MVRLKDGREVYGIIYKITNRANGKVYIGQTTRGFNKRYDASGKGIEKVLKYHERLKNGGYRYNLHLYNSIKKYGIGVFEVEEEFDFAKTEKGLANKERKYIKQFKSFDSKFGYNSTNGGEINNRVIPYEELVRRKVISAMKHNARLVKRHSELKEYFDKGFTLKEIECAIGKSDKTISDYRYYHFGFCYKCEICGFIGSLKLRKPITWYIKNNKTFKNNKKYCQICNDTMWRKKRYIDKNNIDPIGLGKKFQEQYSDYNIYSYSKLN